MNKWTTHLKDYEALLRNVSTIAEKNGFRLNTDKKRVEKVVGLMTENLVATGKPYCPCKQSDPPDLVADVVCPCPEWKNEIGKNGHCGCRLFCQ